MGSFFVLTLGDVIALGLLGLAAVIFVIGVVLCNAAKLVRWFEKRRGR